MITLEGFLGSLHGVKKSGQGFIACCPAHEDRRQSLSVAQGRDGKILVNCHAGCAPERVVEALGLSMRDLLPERDDASGTERATITEIYDYVDENGGLLYQVCRYYPKGFRQRRPGPDGGWLWNLGDARRVLYRLPEVISAVLAGRRVFVVEGEKDVHTLEEWGLVATTSAGGANSWRPDFAQYLAGAHVVIIPDNDEPGVEYARSIKAALQETASSVRLLQLPGLPPHGDVTDWKRAGGTIDELKRMVREPEKAVGLVSMRDVIGDLRRYKSEPMPPGIDYPWHELTRRTHGVRQGWFVIWAGYPGSGKTAALLQICQSAAKQGRLVLLNSLEMSEEELGIRMIQREGLDTSRLFNNRMTDDDRRAFDLAYSIPGIENLQICKDWTLTALTERVGDAKPDLVAVDYIGLMEPGNDSDYQRTTKVSRGLTMLAERFDVPVIALSHLKRPTEDKTSKVRVPVMHDLRASGQLEGDADHIIIVFRDESGDDADGRCQTSEGRFIIAKNRHAPASKPLPVVFDGASMTFRVKELPAIERARERGMSVHEGGGM